MYLLVSLSLDGRVGGLHKSDLIIIAGRPSMGKTAIATNIAFNAARKIQEDKKNLLLLFFFRNVFRTIINKNNI